MFTQIFGAFLFIIGPTLIIYSEWYMENFGRVPWAEQHLGGGTRFFLKLLGVIMMFFGLTMVFGLFGGIVGWIFGPLMPKK
jgi:hypothetical protein